MTTDTQTYRIEVRFDFTGTEDEAVAHAHQVAGQLGAEVTAVFDENWNEV